MFGPARGFRYRWCRENGDRFNQSGSRSQGHGTRLGVDQATVSSCSQCRVCVRTRTLRRDSFPHHDSGVFVDGSRKNFPNSRPGPDPGPRPLLDPSTPTAVASIPRTFHRRNPGLGPILPSGHYCSLRGRSASTSVPVTSQGRPLPGPSPQTSRDPVSQVPCPLIRVGPEVEFRIPFTPTRDHSSRDPGRTPDRSGWGGPPPPSPVNCGGRVKGPSRSSTGSPPVVDLVRGLTVPTHPHRVSRVEGRARSDLESQSVSDGGISSLVESPRRLTSGELSLSAFTGSPSV